MEHPKLRSDIMVSPYQDEERMGVMIQDPMIDGRAMVMSEGAVVLMSLMDGTKSLRDIQSVLMKQTGQLIESDEISDFIKMLDENFLLDNATYRQRLDEIQADYKRQDTRPALMADAGYPADPTELRAFLDEVFQHAQDYQLPENLPDPVRGVVAPHIDLQRGQKTYARVYGALKETPPAKTYVVLGVNHQYPTLNPFIATDRAYETPLGKMPVDSELLTALNEQLDFDLFEGEMAHRSEHSVEFPALFLKYLYPDDELRIVPILSNFVDRNDPKIDQFIGALRELVAEREDVVLISSVDFSHIGPYFGWQREVTDADAATTDREDRITIKFMEENDPDGFYEDIMKDGNQRNIDALGATYVFLKVLDKPGTLIQYEQAFNPVNTVTFTGLIF